MKTQVFYFLRSFGVKKELSVNSFLIAGDVPSSCLVISVLKMQISWETWISWIFILLHSIKTANIVTYGDWWIPMWTFQPVFLILMFYFFPNTLCNFFLILNFCKLLIASIWLYPEKKNSKKKNLNALAMNQIAAHDTTSHLPNTWRHPAGLNKFPNDMCTTSSILKVSCGYKCTPPKPTWRVSVIDTILNRMLVAKMRWKCTRLSNFASV